MHGSVRPKTTAVYKRSLLIKSDTSQQLTLHRERQKDTVVSKGAPIKTGTITTKTR